MKRTFKPMVSLIQRFLQTVVIISPVGTTLALTPGLHQATTAQITPDSTLATTVTSADNLNFVIDGGEICCTQADQHSDNNLFHSFEEFSIPSNGSAIFNNDTSIETIFSRVTGTNISDIDGLIQANSTAAFFLINPNGIIFGSNARLNVEGSFLASTVESILFNNNLDFTAVDPGPAPLLRLDTPIGLQMGTTPGDIQLRSLHDIWVSSNNLISV
ncbi:MAG: filamentous hemagglutinin N-terminal domain-containing protein [Cyanobacteria bacterium P01_F01_bin.150]